MKVPQYPGADAGDGDGDGPEGVDSATEASKPALALLSESLKRLDR
jgi:hypothetical protein